MPDRNDMEDAAPRSDRKELESLRVALARVAQALGATVAHLDVTEETPYERLAALARGQDRGWSALAAACVDEARRLRGLDG